MLDSKSKQYNLHREFVIAIMEAIAGCSKALSSAESNAGKV